MSYVNRDPRSHNYFNLMMRYAAQIKRGEKGLVHITIEHDDWCEALTKEGGFCNCNPTARYGMPDTPKKA